MSDVILLPRTPVLSWFDMVSPREEEMPEFLKLIDLGWRTPKRKWEDLWRLRRGELNHVLGMRRYSLRRYQRGSLGVSSVKRSSLAGTEPTLQDITHTQSSTSPTAARIQLAWDSDGDVEHYFGTELVNVVYSQLTTQSDDTNNHTNDWWPDKPSVNEGLNWDIRYTNLTTGGTGGTRFYFNDGTVNRTEDTWYLLDTVSNDHGDGNRNGAIVLNRQNGTAKMPNTGTATTDVDVEIRDTGSGSALATSTLDLACVGT